MHRGAPPPIVRPCSPCNSHAVCLIMYFEGRLLLVGGFHFVAVHPSSDRRRWLGGCVPHVNLAGESVQSQSRSDTAFQVRNALIAVATALFGEVTWLLHQIELRIEWAHRIWPRFGYCSWLRLGR